MVWQMKEWNKDNNIKNWINLLRVFAIVLTNNSYKKKAIITILILIIGTKYLLNINCVKSSVLLI